MGDGCCEDGAKGSPVLAALLNGIRSTVDHAIQYGDGFETVTEEQARKALHVIDQLTCALRRELDGPVSTLIAHDAGPEDESGRMMVDIPVTIKINGREIGAAADLQYYEQPEPVREAFDYLPIAPHETRERACVDYDPKLYTVDHLRTMIEVLGLWGLSDPVSHMHTHGVPRSSMGSGGLPKWHVYESTGPEGAARVSWASALREEIARREREAA